MKKMYLIALCFGFLFSIINIYAQEGGIAKTVKQTLEIGESYKLKIESTENAWYPKVFNDFKIVVTEDGSLSLSFETFAEMTKVALYNVNGVSLKPTSNDDVSGDSHWNYLNNMINQDGASVLKWNKTVEKFVGSFTYKLDDGIYYLRIARSETGLSTVNLSLGFKVLNVLESVPVPESVPESVPEFESEFESVPVVVDTIKIVPHDTPEEELNWTKIGAIITFIGVLVAIIVGWNNIRKLCRRRKTTPK